MRNQFLLIGLLASVFSVANAITPAEQQSAERVRMQEQSATQKQKDSAQLVQQKQDEHSVSSPGEEFKPTKDQQKSDFRVQDQKDLHNTLSLPPNM